MSKHQDAIEVNAPILRNTKHRLFSPGAGKVEWFQDHSDGPEMIVVPAGSFTMGSPDSEPEREAWQPGTESPQHEVIFSRPFAVARLATTRTQFRAFVLATGHVIKPGAFSWSGTHWEENPAASWLDPGFTCDDSHPVVCVNWADAKAYATWLSNITGRMYRLPSEAEREYVTRAGATSTFWWGPGIETAQANYESTTAYKGGGSPGPWRRATMPALSFEANPWGLLNVHGNSRDWCEDVWHDSYVGAPGDGSAWLADGDQNRHVVRGGCWDYGPQYLRAAYRDWCVTERRVTNLGFRLVVELSH